MGIFLIHSSHLWPVLVRRSNTMSTRLLKWSKNIQTPLIVLGGFYQNTENIQYQVSHHAQEHTGPV